jgi:DNA replication and repair protein RecF
MYFKSLTLQNFRNYDSLVADFHPNVNIVTGENAQGKTNLIEALYFMSLGKSFRTFRDSELIGFQKDFCRLKSVFVKDGDEQTLDFTISGEAKEARLNGVKLTKNSDLLEQVYTVIFSPEDLKIVKDEPEKRRRFIDRELCMMDPIYYRALSRYKKALLQRNNLLRENRPDKGLVSVWNEALANEGAKIIRRRASFIERLNTVSSGLHDSITQGKEKLKLTYESDCERADDQEALFFEILERNYEHDLFRRTTTKGPHRDDIGIEIDGTDARRYGSQGQQRTAALSLKLAEINLIREETGEDAVLLLDDVLSELDPNRQAFLLKTLSSVQLFITAAERSASLLEKIPAYRLFIIENGAIREMFDVE